MGKYYHFTTLDNLYGILESKGIFPYSTHSGYRDTEFVSLTDDEYMLMINNDGRYSNHNVRIAVEIEDVIKIDYSLDFFRNNPDIAAYVFTDLNDDIDHLYEEGYFDDSYFNYLKKESEFLSEYYIDIKEFCDITLLEGHQYKSYRHNISIEDIIKITEHLNIDCHIAYSWEDSYII